MQSTQLFIATVALLVAAGIASKASAQNGQPVTVQLPTFQMTGVSTTVLVPDRGQTFLGGINSSSSGASEFGVPLLPGRPFRNRAIGSDRSATNFWTRVWIHDFQAMDEALLSQAAAARGGQSSLVDGRRVVMGAEFVTAQPQREKSELVELLTRDAGQPENAQTAANLQLAKARKLAAEGKLGVAKIYYQMAIRRAAGADRDLILAEMATAIEPATVAADLP